jgi:hypothetical protein
LVRLYIKEIEMIQHERLPSEATRILMSLFVIAGLISFGLGFWSGESLLKKNDPTCNKVCPAGSVKYEEICYCDLSR